MFVNRNNKADNVFLHINPSSSVRRAHYGSNPFSVSPPPLFFFLLWYALTNKGFSLLPWLAIYHIAYDAMSKWTISYLFLSLQNNSNYYLFVCQSMWWEMCSTYHWFSLCGDHGWQLTLMGKKREEERKSLQQSYSRGADHKLNKGAKKRTRGSTLCTPQSGAQHSATIIASITLCI